MSETARHVIIGTAGHVDHGKSAIVKALTGTDPDRLKEEKERGLTIDLGFAFLGEHAAIIDVPGHERFIKNMVAGVSTIDFVLLVVAADDGVMPQTREHLEILNLLRVRKGIIAINKIDLVDKDWLALVREDVESLVKGTFLEGAPVVEVSAQTGEGIDQLRKVIDEHIAAVPPREDRGFFFLPIDRAFVIRGFGTVVTGSVLSGSAAVGDRLEILPSGIEVRVRGLQRHGKPVERVHIAERAALNLMGVEKEQIQRGDVLVQEGIYRPTRYLDVKLQLLKSANRPLKHLARVRLHLGTGEYLCRVALLDRELLHPGEEAFAQLRLEEDVVANWGAPFVIRSYSPLVTIGGGVILDLYPPRRRHRKDGLAFLQEQASEDMVRAVQSRVQRADVKAVTVEDLSRQLTLSRATLAPVIERLVADGTISELARGNQRLYLHSSVLERLENALLETLRAYHREKPTQKGMNRSALQEKLGRDLDNLVFDAVLSRVKQSGAVVEEGPVVRLATHSVTLTEEQEKLRERVLRELAEAGFSPPTSAELARALRVPAQEMLALLQAMAALGELVPLEDDLFLPRHRVEEAKQKLFDLTGGEREFSVSEFREMLGTTRRYALGLLTYFDQLGITHRVGDKRKLATSGQQSE